MPVVSVEYPIANRLLLKATGTINLSEMITVMAAFRGRDTRLTPILFDLAGATISVSAAEVAALAQMMALEMKKAPMGPVALIADRDEVFGLGRMFQSYSVASGRPDVGVFRDLTAAERWLEIL
jgi:hypothetical protein